MNWLQIVLLVLKLLQQAKQHETAEGFAASSGAVGANGEILKWVWEHRQEIIDFISMFFKSSPPVIGSVGPTDEVRQLLHELKS